MGSGILIAVEGIDGAGKTTQVRLLGEALERAGESVVCSKEPTDGPWGRKIREAAISQRLSLDEELEAFIEDRKEHVATTIEPALAAGKTVILDRYFYSTIAYQGSRGGDIAALADQMRRMFPVPDIVILIDLDPAIALDRISHSRGDVPNAFERLDSLQAVRDVFLSLAANDPLLRIVDGIQDVEAVHRSILRHLLDGPLARRSPRRPDT